MPVSLQDLMDTIKRLFQANPEVMVRKAVFGMKNRAAKLVQVEGKAIEEECIKSNRIDINSY
jgi:hypothetical protein